MDEIWKWLKEFAGMATDPALAAVDHVITNRNEIRKRAQVRFWIGFALMAIGLIMGFVSGRVDGFLPLEIVGRVAVLAGGILMYVGFQIVAAGIVAATAYGLVLIAFIDLIPGEGFEVLKRKLAEMGLQGASTGDGNIRLVGEKKEKLFSVFKATQMVAFYILTVALINVLLLSWLAFGLLLVLGLGGFIVIGLMLLDGQEVGHFHRVWIRTVVFTVVATFVYALLRVAFPDFVAEVWKAGNIGPKMAEVLRSWTAGHAGAVATVAVITVLVCIGFGILAFLRRVARPIDTVPQQKQREEVEKHRAGQVVIPSTVTGPGDGSIFGYGLIAALIIAAISFYALGGVPWVKEMFKKEERPAAAAQAPAVEARPEYHYEPYVPPTRDERQEGRRARRLANRGEGEAADPVNAARMDALINRRR